jgi:hypothetical protein
MESDGSPFSNSVSVETENCVSSVGFADCYVKLR